MKSIIKIVILASLVSLAPSSATANSPYQPSWWVKCKMYMPGGPGVGKPWWTDVPCWAGTFFD